MLARYLARGLESLEESGGKPDDIEPNHRLMFIVRDWTDTERFNYGFCDDYLVDDYNYGEEDFRMKYEEVKRTFPNIGCVLLPHPGLIVERPHFLNDISSLDEDFRHETKDFIETLFDPRNLLPEQYTLTGNGLYELLMTFDGRVANDSLSFMNVYTERVNFLKVAALKEEFFAHNVDSKMHPSLVKRLMEEIMEKAENVLMKGRSYQTSLADLRTVLSKYANKFIKFFVVDLYKTHIEKGTYEHKSRWVELTNLLKHYLCGDDELNNITLQAVAQETAKVYYSKLSKEKLEHFMNICNKSLASLEDAINSNEIQLTLCRDFGDLVKDQTLTYPIWLMEKDSLKQDIHEEYLKSVNELTNEDTSWLQSARRKQYEYLEASNVLNTNVKSKWNIISNKNTTANRQLLSRKIGYALFGVTSSESINYSKCYFINKNALSEEDSKYSESEKQKINAILSKVIELSSTNSILMSCIFILYNGNGKDINIPIFKIQDLNSKVFFLDSNARVYCNFADFQKSNTLPPVTYCYPSNGNCDKFEGLGVAYARAPSTTIVSRVVDVADTTGNATNVVAGIGCVLALVGVAPIVGPAAIIGGGVSGAYGLTRGIYKMYNKYKHKEKIKLSDIWKVTSNTFSVVTMGTGAVADRFFTLATKISHGVLAFNSVTAVFCPSDESPALISFLNETAEKYLKSLFFFNADSIDNAIKQIQEQLGIEGEPSIQQTLELLLENNSVHSTEEIGRSLVMKKYVSQGMCDLVTGLLKNINFKTANAIIKHHSIDDISLLGKAHASTQVINFRSLFNCFEQENKDVKEMLTKCIDGSEVISNSNFEALLSSQDNLHIVLAARYFLCSILNKVSGANNWYSNVPHSPLQLVGYHSDYHPFEEVVRLVTTMINQNETVLELAQDYHVEVLQKLLVKSLSLCNSSGALADKMINNTEALLQLFTDRLDREQKFIDDHSKTKNIHCHDLKGIFEMMGIHTNFGKGILDNVFDDFLNDPNYNVGYNSESVITIVPAWTGVLDRLYMYYSSTSLTDKFTLIKCLFGNNNYNSNNYIENSLAVDLITLTPCVGELFFPQFIVYSPINHHNKGECGLIWQSPEHTQQPE